MTSKNVTAVPDEVLRAAAEILQRCRFADVRAEKISATLLESDAVPVVEVKFRPNVQYSIDEGRLVGRYTYVLTLRGAEERPVAQLEVVLHGMWDVPVDYAPDSRAAEYVVVTTGYFAVYPYLRELVQSLSGRLGLNQVVLGALPRNELGPAGATIRVRSAPEVLQTPPAD